MNLPVKTQSMICIISLSLSPATAVSSLKEVDAFGSTSGAESDLQLIMQSETFQNCLLVMEKSILGNTFQPDLAAYRQLPVLEGNTLQKHK